MAKLPDELPGRQTPRPTRGVASVRPVDYSGASRAIGQYNDQLQRAGEQMSEQAQEIQHRSIEREKLIAAERENEVKRQVVDMLYGTDKVPGLYSRKGAQALDIDQEFQTKYDEIRKGVRNGIGNPLIIQQFEGALDNFGLSQLDNIRRYQAQEKTDYEKVLTETSLKNAKDYVSLEYNNDQTFQQRERETEAAAMTLARLQGFAPDDDATKALVTKARGDLYQTRIASMVGTNDPDQIIEANKLFLKAKATGKITDLNTLSALDQGLRKVVGPALAQKAYSRTGQIVGAGNVVLQNVADMARMEGIDPAYAVKVAQIESGGNPKAKNPASSAGGLFQFIDTTWQQYGAGADKFDADANSKAFIALTKDNARQFRDKMGREPTNGELYLMHQQGAAGAIKLLSNPMMTADAIVGADAVQNNGGKPGMSAADFAKLWTSKIDMMPTPGTGTRVPNQDEINALASVLDQNYPGYDAGKELLALHEASVKAIEQQRKAREREIVTQATSILAGSNGDPRAIPPDLRMEAIRSGVNIDGLYKGMSDPDTVRNFYAMSADQQANADIEGWMAQGLLAYDDGNKMLTHRDSLANPNGKLIAGLIDRGAETYYVSKGKDMASLSSDDKTRVAAAKQHVAAVIDDWQRTNPGKVPSVADVNKAYLDYFTQPIKGTEGWFGSPETLATLKASDIPQTERAMIIQQLQLNGLNTSEAMIKAMYAQLKNAGAL